MNSLHTLILTGCSGLTSLPNSLAKLSKLTTLDLRCSSNLRQLPVKLPPLETLVLSADSKLVQDVQDRKDHAGNALLGKVVLEIKVCSRKQQSTNDKQEPRQRWYELPSNIKGLIIEVCVRRIHCMGAAQLKGLVLDGRNLSCRPVGQALPGHHTAIQCLA